MTDGFDTRDLDHLETIDDVTGPPPASGVELAPGARVAGKYVIERLLGHGGMGAVYLARDERLGRDVAIKVGLAGGAGALERAEREARVLAKLSHPNVVVIYEVGEHADRLFVAMEYVTGGTVRAWLEAAPRTWREIVALYAEAGTGLAAAHAAGIVHRDFKPDNVLVGADGRPRVADFGVARAVGSPAASDAPTPADAARSTPDDNLTRTGFAVGTPAYMAPEQLTLADVDARVDQFAFCVALWEALYGTRPFTGATKAELADAMRVQPKPPTSRAVPRYVTDALRRGLAVEPSERWPSMSALVARLRRVRSRRGLALVLAAVVAAGAVVATSWVHARRDRAEACDAVAQRIGAAWSPFDAGMVRENFLATKRHHAAATVDLVHTDLDQYASSWSDMRRDVCLATTVREEQSQHSNDLRVQCLDRLADQVRALVVVFERDADASTVDQAVGAVRSLQPTTTCADATRLADRSPPPDKAARIAELQAAHDAIEAGYVTGRYQPLLARAKANAKAAVELGYAPLAAEALMTLGHFDAILHAHADAERDDKDAIAFAGIARDDHAENVAWRTLIRQAVEQNHFDEAIDRLTYARAAVARSGNEPHYVMRLEIEEANLWKEKGDYSAALAVADASLALAKRLSPIDLGQADNGRARILNQLHRPADALVALREAEQIYASEFGTENPEVGGELMNIALAEFELRQWDDAERDLDRAAEILEATFGHDSLFVARVLSNRCEVRFELRRIADATADCARALAIKTKVSGPDSPELGSTLLAQARVVGLRDDASTEAAIVDRAVANYEKALGPNHPKLALALQRRAEHRLSGGKLADARADAERSMTIAQQAHDAIGAATALADIADIERAQGQLDAARTSIRDALVQDEAIAKTNTSPEIAADIAHDHAVAGAIDARAGDLATAERELRLAVDGLEPISGTNHAQLAAPLEQLGGVLLAAAKPHDAVLALGRAVSILGATSGSPLERATTQRELAQAQWADGDRAGALAAAHEAAATFAQAPTTPPIVKARADTAAWLAAHH